MKLVEALIALLFLSIVTAGIFGELTAWMRLVEHRLSFFW